MRNLKNSPEQVVGEWNQPQVLSGNCQSYCFPPDWSSEWQWLGWWSWGRMATINFKTRQLILRKMMPPVCPCNPIPGRLNPAEIRWAVHCLLFWSPLLKEDAIPVGEHPNKVGGVERNWKCKRDYSPNKRENMDLAARGNVNSEERRPVSSHYCKLVNWWVCHLKLETYDEKWEQHFWKVEEERLCPLLFCQGSLKFILRGISHSNKGIWKVVRFLKRIT